MRCLTLVWLVFVLCHGPAVAEEKAEVITSVDIQKIAANSLLKDLKLEKSETGDCPVRHLYYFSGKVIVAISVHPSKTEASTFLDRVRRGISIGGVPIEGLGDDAQTTEERRYDFRLNNLVVSVMGSRTIAESIAAALKTSSQKGKAIEALLFVTLDTPKTAKPGERLQFTVKLSSVKEPHAITFQGEHRVTPVASWKNEDTWTYALEQDMPPEKGPYRLELEILAPGNIVLMRTATIEIR